MDEDEDQQRRGASFAGLAVAVVIVLLTVLVLHFISGNLKTERCVEERRHGCGEDVSSP